MVLEPLLILALEFVIERDTPDVGAFVPQSLCRASVCAIKLGIMRQLTRPTHAAVEGLLAGIVAVAAMGLQQVMTALA